MDISSRWFVTTNYIAMIFKPLLITGAKLFVVLNVYSDKLKLFICRCIINVLIAIQSVNC